MNEKTYGRLWLDGADLDVIRQMLERGRDMCSFKAATAQDPDEEAYYEKTYARSEKMVARFEATKPGRVAFTESDLAFVRGMVFPTLFPELMGQYARRKELSTEEVDILSRRITHLSALQQKFDGPLIADKSQDAEPEEDIEEDSRKGADHVEAQATALAPPVADDGRVLSAISKAVFYTGFSWKLVDRKWPGFEEAFEAFDPGWLNIQPDEFWDDRMRDPRIVRSPRRVASIRRNTVRVGELSSIHGGAITFFRSWPDDDLVGLHTFVEKQFDGLGWYGSQFVLRIIGRDTFVISPDLVAALKLAGVPIEGTGRSVRDRKVVQDTLLRWRQQTGRSLTYLSRACSMSL